MNFKTTIFLIALLIIAGVTVYFVHQQPAATTEAPSATKSLLSISQDDVAKVSITPADGQPLVMEHAGSNWTITQPVHAKADTFAAGDLVREICELQSHAQVGTDVATGVDHPTYRVELTDKAGKTTTLNFGTKSDVGDNLYVRVGDQSQVDVVSADVQGYLDKSLSDYRDMNLITATADNLQSVDISGNPGWGAYLVRVGGKWKLGAPYQIFVTTEQSAVDDLLSTLTSLRAAAFVDHPLPAVTYQFNHPQLVVTYRSTSPGSPATTQPIEKRIIFGGYDDLRKQNVFAQVDGQVVKIAASTMDSLNKTNLDLRDRTVIDIDPAQVTQIELQRHLPASTQPTSRSASNVDLIIARNPKLPSTTQASTQATSKPTAVWVFANNQTATVNEANVNDVLTNLHPLKAEKYLEKMRALRPSDQFHLIVTTKNEKHEFDFYADPANETNGIGFGESMMFEVPNTFIDHLKLDFGWPTTVK
jgi:Domain of unknown function (DUF4340)